MTVPDNEINESPRPCLLSVQELTKMTLTLFVSSVLRLQKEQTAVSLLPPFNLMTVSQMDLKDLAPGYFIKAGRGSLV